MAFPEIKPEVGAIDAEPVFQMALYYTTQLRLKMPLSLYLYTLALVCIS